MTHPLVDQLRFARSEWIRALQDITEQDARRQFPPMNCISWMIGHMAWQEQMYWLERAQGRLAVPGLDHTVGVGRPASTPPLAQMWQAWHSVTDASDPYLDTLSGDKLLDQYTVDGEVKPATIGTNLLRVTYHYWYHIGESQAVRQLLGHQDLPQFVGDIHSDAPYRQEAADSAERIAVATH
jgi:hypothetical protein